MSTISGLLACVLLILLAFSSKAQQPSPPPAGQQPVRIKTNEVLLDVLVHDKKGRPVRDLKPEEIEVFEDGVKQSIAQFAVIGSTRKIYVIEQFTNDRAKLRKAVELVDCSKSFRTN